MYIFFAIRKSTDSRTFGKSRCKKEKVTHDSITHVNHQLHLGMFPSSNFTFLKKSRIICKFIPICVI